MSRVHRMRVLPQVLFVWWETDLRVSLLLFSRLLRVIGTIHTVLTCVGNWQAVKAQVIHGHEGPGADIMAWKVVS